MTRKERRSSLANPTVPSTRPFVGLQRLGLRHAARHAEFARRLSPRRELRRCDKRERRKGDLSRHGRDQTPRCGSLQRADALDYGLCHPSRSSQDGFLRCSRRLFRSSAASVVHRTRINRDIADPYEQRRHVVEQLLHVRRCAHFDSARNHCRGPLSSPTGRAPPDRPCAGLRSEPRQLRFEFGRNLQVHETSGLDIGVNCRLAAHSLVARQLAGGLSYPWSAVRPPPQQRSRDSPCVTGDEGKVITLMPCRVVARWRKGYRRLPGST